MKMLTIPRLFLTLTFVLILTIDVHHTKQITNADNGATKSVSNHRFDLMVAFQKSYYPQFLNVTNGEWQVYPVKTIIDLSDKSSVLNFCKQVYPNKDIKNYVKDYSQVRINGWCSVKAPWKKICKKSFDVQPYRCLEQFQADPLLVPNNCVFDHIQNQSRCWSFDRWNKTAQLACRDRGLKIESFAMLLPCREISVFSGVEFVCCPKKVIASKKSEFPIMDNDEVLDFKDDLVKDDDENNGDGDDSVLDEPDQEEDFDDSNEKDELEKEEEELDDDYKFDDSVELAYSSVKISVSTPILKNAMSSSTTTTTTTTTLSPDPYFSNYDPKHEHANYIAAIKRADKHFDGGIRALKAERADFEGKYQELLIKDYKEADEYRNKTMADLKRRHEALEADRDLIKNQIMDMHKQRVAANINQLVKNATINFWNIMKKPKVSVKDVYPVIFSFLKAHNKDRSHTYARYKHLLDADFDWARDHKNQILEHLLIIGTKVNESINYLKEKQSEIWYKLKDSIDNLNDEMQLHSPIVGSVLEINKENESKMLDEYIMNAGARRASLEQEKYRKRLEKEKIKKEQLRQMRLEHDKKNEEKLENSSHVGKSATFYDGFVTESKVLQVPTPKHVSMSPKSPEITEVKIERVKKIDKVNNEAVQQTMEDVAAIIHEQHHDVPVAHSLLHKMNIDDSTSETDPTIFDPKPTSTFARILMGLSCFSCLVILGLIMMKKRSARSPQRQGFIEVDQTISPEERHMTQMQINGYENPTYKYFEVKD